MGLDLYIEKRKRNKNTETLAYFRKVNFLIPFFEKYYNIEMENCEYYPIDKQYCIDLLDTCEEVLNNPSKAPELLPTCSLFFFGSTEYDDHYFDDIHEVIESIEDCVIPEFDNLEEDEEISFYIWY